MEGSSILIVLLVILLFSFLLFILGLYEKDKHQKNIDSIPIRININGIRGKSTVTRLITGIVRESDYNTVGKTTGTMARMIYNSGQEEPILRRAEGPNIREQMDITKKASKVNAEALVSECMAVNPDYQIIFQKDLLQANIGVIVNVLEDHMDVMGPTLNEVAEAFTATIPYNGYLIVNDSDFVPYFQEIAQKRGTTVKVCNTSRVSEAFLRQFEYMVFPDNVALALAVADVLNINEDTACKGMLHANPDPGAMRIISIGDNNPSFFVNGFAANDTASTINIWERVKKLGYPTEKPIVIMNARDDRLDRTEQFAHEVLPKLDVDILIAIGSGTSPITYAYKNNIIRANQYINLEDYSSKDIIERLAPFLYNRTIYGVGNIHGKAEPLIDDLYALKQKGNAQQKTIVSG